MARVLIMTTAVNYAPHKLLPFWKSLERVGFRGQIVYAVDKKSIPVLKENLPPASQLIPFEIETAGLLLQQAPLPVLQLIAEGAHVLDPAFLGKCMAINAPWTLNFIAAYNHSSVARYLLYIQHLSKVRNDIDKVILCDVRDVIFQRNPEEALENATGLHLVYEKPTTLIGAEPYNTSWIKQIYGDEALARYTGNRISCSGAIYGDMPAVYDYLQRMCGEIMMSTHRIKGSFGCDQGIQNKLLWEKSFPNATISENLHDEIVHLNDYKIGELEPFYQDGTLVREDTKKPIMLVHQYDRCPELCDRILKTLDLTREEVGLDPTENR